MISRVVVFLLAFLIILTYDFSPSWNEQGANQHTPSYQALKGMKVIFNIADLEPDTDNQETNKIFTGVAFSFIADLLTYCNQPIKISYTWHQVSFHCSVPAFILQHKLLI